MSLREDFTDTVGNTPLIKLKRASEITGCTILGKAEFLNPGGSVKDRAAKYIILDAEQRGDLGPGGVVVEGTAGNTGIGLALVAAIRGYRLVCVMPEKMSEDKRQALRALGAEVVITDKPEEKGHAGGMGAGMGGMGGMAGMGM